MAHFAEIKDGVVERVIVADTKEWCETNLGGEWVQTSYNTRGGIHLGPLGLPDGGIALHKNYAGIGYSWDGIGFAAPQPYPSWTLNQQSYLWEPPTPKPETGFWEWNEEDLEWVEIPVSE